MAKRKTTHKRPGKRPASKKRPARAKRSHQGVSLHLGLNRVDPGHYAGWNGELSGCEFDAKDMKALADGQGFKSQLLLSRDATANAVIAAISAAAQALRAGDTFFLSYSGHGGQVPDTNGDEQEDQRDETWVLYDRQLIDDELYALWGRFEPGVRVVMLSDSCHSGTVSRVAVYEALTENVPATPGMAPVPQARFRLMPPGVRDRTYAQNREAYDAIQAAHPSGERVAVGASVLLISGCQDNQLSSDGDRNGLFTQNLLAVWDKGRFQGGYRKFHKAIHDHMPPWQSPNYFRVGHPDMRFERQTPFTIG
jgi:metacaspase-1